jgi:myo-inositol 2-dehydrogenase/D-chiro-inositol 1-dehydrogenase
MSEVGVALLGLGRAGSFHLESLRSLPQARLLQVYDPDQAKAERVAREMGCRQARDAEQAIRAAGVAAVVVATPTLTHHGLVLAALDAGRPVLSEKPLGVTPEEIDQCFARAGEQGVPLLVAFQRRFDPSFAAVLEAAHAGQAGELQFIRSVSRDNPVPSIDYIRTSCGIFHDCAVHDIDMVCQLAGAAPEQVFAFASSFIPEIDAVGDVDNVAIVLRFPGGLLASIDVNRKSAYGYDQRLEVFGRGGMLQVENRPQTLTVSAAEAGIARPPVDPSFPTRYRDAYRAEFACFLDCVRGTRQVPITHEQVRRSHAVADAAERSFREGRPVAPAL